MYIHIYIYIFFLQWSTCYNGVSACVFRYQKISKVSQSTSSLLQKKHLPPKNWKKPQRNAYETSHMFLSNFPFSIDKIHLRKETPGYSGRVFFFCHHSIWTRNFSPNKNRTPKPTTKPTSNKQNLVSLKAPVPDVRIKVPD